MYNRDEKMELKNLKINVLGDSITEGIGSCGIENSYPSVIHNLTGALVRNYGLNGSRIAKYPEIEDWRDFNSRALTMESDADVVIVFGGTNDFGHGSYEKFGTSDSRDKKTFLGALRVLFETLNEKYPAAFIMFMTPLHRITENETVNEHGKPKPVLEEYSKAAKSLAEALDIHVLDMRKLCPFTPMNKDDVEKYIPDGLHPSAEGSAILAEIIVDYLEKNISE